MREVCVGDERRDGAVGDLGVRVMRPHDAVYVAHKNRLDLERAKFAVFAASEVISV